MPPLQPFLEDLYDRYRDVSEGRLASYIPELTKGCELPEHEAFWSR